MFGVPMIDHDARYDMAAEWIEIMMKLWTLEEDFDYDGKYYQVKRGTLAPKPIQRPYPAIMNAGGSGKGQHFSAKYSDIAFIQFDYHDIEFAKKKVETYKRLAREEYGRDMEIWSFGYVVQRETEKEAKDFLHHYVHEKGDWVAAGNLIEMLGIEFVGGRAGLSKAQSPLHGRVGRIPAGRHQGADRRRARRLGLDRNRRRAVVVAAVRGRHAGVPERDAAAA